MHRVSEAIPPKGQINSSIGRPDIASISTNPRINFSPALPYYATNLLNNLLWPG